MGRLIFSGHEKFHCRNFWLKKGYDFVESKRNFGAPDAVIELGVGKNMVRSIRFWMRAFNLVSDEGELAELSRFLFNDDQGADPYLEDIASSWLLHYNLVKQGNASIYDAVFNRFRRLRTEFTRTQLLEFLKHLAAENGESVNENTVANDIAVLLKNYVRPRRKRKSIEDEFSGILIDLGLIREIEGNENAAISYYKFNLGSRSELPVEVFLFVILDHATYGDSISFTDLLAIPNSPGMVFGLTPDGLYDKIRELVKKFSGITFTDDAGIKELQLAREDYDKWGVLREYYGN